METGIRVIIFLLLVLGPHPVWAEWYQEARNKMGTRVFVKLWHEDEKQARQILADAMAEVDRIEASMSTYRADSAISRINADAAADWVVAGSELFGLIEQALKLSKQTGGAFDITYDSVGQFYNFREPSRPTAAQVETGLSAIDPDHVRLDGESFSVRFSHPGTRINLGGIAKGYTVESVSRLLKGAGIRNALVNAGGDTRVLGDRLEGPWVIGVRDPDDELKFATRLALKDAAISTSGDYEQFFVDNGVRYHHILNPSTGSPASGVRSATIIGPDAAMTDGLSTSVFVMGPEAGIKLIESLPEYDGIVIDQDRRMYVTPGINPLRRMTSQN